MKKFIQYTLIMVVNFIVIAFPVSMIFAETNTESKIDISITPQNFLFDITDMKPGDWAPRTFVIQNNGTMEFEYQMSLQNNGEEKLFNELMLDISDNDAELFNGKLVDFTTLALRNLTSGSKEELHVTIRFPEHLGNEFQGLETHFTLLFTANSNDGKSDEVSIGGVIDSDDDLQNNGAVLPKTATDIFNFLLIGGLLLACGGFLVIYNKKNSNQDNNKHL